MSVPEEEAIRARRKLEADKERPRRNCGAGTMKIKEFKTSLVPCSPMQARQCSHRVG
jgi:hypothetical protein